MIEKLFWKYIRENESDEDHLNVGLYVIKKNEEKAKTGQKNVEETEDEKKTDKGPIYMDEIWQNVLPVEKT
jgi:hypothetical protein